MAYTYYPGCAIGASSVPYGTSTQAVCRVLGVELNELDDWNCCGATAYIAVRELRAFALSARNLALAKARGDQLITPCNGCYVALNKTAKYYETDRALREQIDDALAAGGVTYDGGLRVRHLLDVLVNDVGPEQVQTKLKSSLDGLKVAPYYGCQISRPFDDFDHAEFPSTLDRLLAATEATIVPFPLKARCCGGMLMSTDSAVARRLVRNLIRCAQAQGADCIATTCPLCQINLECYQNQISAESGEPVRMPIYYFTQLLGLALDVPQEDLKLESMMPPADRALARFV